MKYITVEYSIN